MLKGLVISAHRTDELERELEADGIRCVRPRGGAAEDYARAAAELGAGPDELLCLVETDADEKAAVSAGFICIGYVNPDLDEQELWGCMLLLTGFDGVDLKLLTDTLTRALGLPVTVAETERLLIREMTLEDAFEDDEEKARAYIEHMYGLCQFGIWTLVEKKSGRVIGRAGLGIAEYQGRREIDLGYGILEQYRRKGYAYESCLAVLDYARNTLGIERLAAYIEDENEASVNLIKKLGFRHTESFQQGGKVLHGYVKELQTRTQGSAE